MYDACINFPSHRLPEPNHDILDYSSNLLKDIYSRKTSDNNNSSTTSHRNPRRPKRREKICFHFAFRTQPAALMRAHEEKKINFRRRWEGRHTRSSQWKGKTEASSFLLVLFGKQMCGSHKIRKEAFYTSNLYLRSDCYKKS